MTATGAVTPTTGGGGSAEVLDTTGLVTVQDAGRPGYAHLGVPRAGWLDPAAAAFANRLVGNPVGAAVVEVGLGSLELRADTDLWVAVTGATCPVAVDGSARGHGRAEWVPAGSRLRVGTPSDGVRSYVALGGGVAVAPVLGSRSTDTLAWVGPPRVEGGTLLPLGPRAGPPAAVDVPAPRRPGPLRVDPGPHLDRFADDALERLCAATYRVTADSNRVGLRLDGPSLERVRRDELASAGLVLGAVQVPPDGRPVVFLADHPTTGGYPVVAVVRAADLAQCAQWRPGDVARFARATP